jgi:hypothetical protein
LHSEREALLARQPPQQPPPQQPQQQVLQCARKTAFVRYESLTRAFAVSDMLRSCSMSFSAIAWHKLPDTESGK